MSTAKFKERSTGSKVDQRSGWRAALQRSCYPYRFFFHGMIVGLLLLAAFVAGVMLRGPALLQAVPGHGDGRRSSPVPAGSSIAVRPAPAPGNGERRQFSVLPVPQSATAANTTVLGVHIAGMGLLTARVQGEATNAAALSGNTLAASPFLLTGEQLPGCPGAVYGILYRVRFRAAADSLPIEVTWRSPHDTVTRSRTYQIVDNRLQLSTFSFPQQSPPLYGIWRVEFSHAGEKIGQQELAVSPAVEAAVL